MSDEVKDVIDGLGRAFEEFKSANDTNLKKRDGVTEEKLSRLDAEINRLQEAVTAVKQLDARADEIEKKLGRAQFAGGAGAPVVPEAELKSHNAALVSFAGMLGRPVPQEQDADALRHYGAAFKSFLRSANYKWSDAEHKAMSVGSDPDGGYLVPPTVSNRVVTRIFETSPIRQIASVQEISTDSLEGMADLNEAGSGGWVSETGSRSETGTPQLGKWSIFVHEMYAQPKATQRLLDDSTVDVETWLANKVADKLSRVENAAFCTGTGVGQPRGLFAYPTAATSDASRPWGTFEHIATGVNGDLPASNPADVFISMTGAVKDAYLANARWLTRREIVTKVRKIKDTTGQYIWQPGLQAGKPQEILGYPVVIAADTPALGTGSLSAAFGDFREAYQIVDRQGIRVIRDNLTAKPYVLFYTTRRVGGGALQFECVKFLRLA